MGSAPFGNDKHYGGRLARQSAIVIKFRYARARKISRRASCSQSRRKGKPLFGGVLDRCNLRGRFGVAFFFARRPARQRVLISDAAGASLILCSATIWMRITYCLIRRCSQTWMPLPH